MVEAAQARQRTVELKGFCQAEEEMNYGLVRNSDLLVILVGAADDPTRSEVLVLEEQYKD